MPRMAEGRRTDAGIFGSIVKSIILPRPSPSYDTAVHPGKLLHIPKVDWSTRQENGAFTYGLLLLDPTAKYLVIYAHTNAVDMAMMFDELSYLGERASTSVLLFEYTGYGISDGETTEISMNEDMLSAYCYAVRYLQVPANRIVLMGRSIGTGPSVQLCALLQDAEETPALLVLQSPFTSVMECANKITHVGSIMGFLGYDWFRTIDVIARVRCPIIIQHGGLDDVVPFEHAERLKRVIEDATPPGLIELHEEKTCRHNDLPVTNAAHIVGKKLRGLGQERCLQLKCRPYRLVNPPIYEYLFCVNGKRITCVESLLRHWNETLALGSFVCKREKLHVLLVASVALFAMRCALVWQRYIGSWKQDHSGKAAGEDPHCSKEEIINRCLACWGSPLGIFVGAQGKSPVHKIFGVHFPANGVSSRNDSSNIGSSSFMACDDRPPHFGVAELEFTPGLMKSVVVAVSTAPTLTGEANDMGVFLQKDIVTWIQTECERIMAFLDDNEWENLRILLLNFNAKAPTFLSSKALHLFNECTSPSGEESTHRRKKESIVDLEEWLQPWIASTKAQSNLGGEVPWDYYLFKARRCVRDDHQLRADLCWLETRKIVEAWRVVAEIHRLFKKYSRRCLRPTFIAV